MDTVPKQIPNKEKTIIDGEVICDYLAFSEFEGEFKNPRNLAAGAIRCLSSKESASRKLSFIAWDLIEGIDEDFFMWRLEKLDDWGFTTVPRVGDAETVEDAIGILDNMEIEKELYPIDGYVFKFESKSYGESLGHTEHHFRNAIAYKFYDELYETKLKYITYDVSRNGVLTPVAVFEPIEIDGTVVEKSSLHNMSIMKEVLGKTPYCGETVWVYKANQIIPQIAKANKMEYGDIIYNGGQYTIIKAFVPNIGETYGNKSILENNNFDDKLYDNNGIVTLFGSDGSGINTSNDGIEIVSLEDIPDPESEELF
jgi:DNA ligase (NAD+)